MVKARAPAHTGGLSRRCGACPLTASLQGHLTIHVGAIILKAWGSLESHLRSSSTSNWGLPAAGRSVEGDCDLFKNIS